jgi:hypothetical protein
MMKKQFKVWSWGASAAELDRGFAVVIEGPAVTDYIADHERIAAFIESTLNAAFVVFPKSDRM